MTPKPDLEPVATLVERLKQAAIVLDVHARNRRLPPGDNDFADSASYMREAASALLALEGERDALRKTLETLTVAVENMRVPQNVAEAAMQVELTIGPAVKAARSALSSSEHI
jgi:hypothetical protein